MSKRVITSHICDGCGKEITDKQIGARVTATMFDEAEPYARSIELCGKDKGLNNCAASLPEGTRQAVRGRKTTQVVEEVAA